MNLEQAAEILTRERHDDKTWVVVHETDNPDDGYLKGYDDDCIFINGFQAVALAKEYERRAGRDMPATRLMVRRLKMCAFDDVTMQAKVAETMSRYEINAAAAEWCGQPNPSTETDA